MDTPPSETKVGTGVGFERDVRASRHLHQIAVAALVLVGAYYGFNAEVRDPLHLYLGLAMLVLAFWPSLTWARTGQTALPVFEVFMLTGATTFALPLLEGHAALLAFPVESVTRAAFGVVLFQVAALVAFRFVRAWPRRSRFWTEDIFSVRSSRWLVLGLTANTAYIAVTTFTQWIPWEVTGVLRAVFFGIGILCSFVGCRYLGEGVLNGREKVALAVNMAAQVVMLASSLVLVRAISLMAISLLGFVSGARRIPWPFTLAMVGVVALLHVGKGPMREKYWEHGAAAPGPLDMPAFYGDWIAHGLSSQERKSGEMTSKLIDRTSLFHLLCLVVDRSPRLLPYLEGETYLDLPAQLVPRFLWPDKPFGHVSTYRLAVYYGLQTPEATQRTTIGFGVLPEAYANFGFAGLVMLGLGIGAMLKWLREVSSASPLLSYGGLVSIVLLAWSFQTELTVSGWVTSMLQAQVAVLGVPWFVRKVVLSA